MDANNSSGLHPALQQLLSGQSPPAELQPLINQIDQQYKAYDSQILQLQAEVQHRTDQLIASTSRAYSFLDSLNMGFILADVNGEVAISNQAVRRILSSKMVSSSEPQSDNIPETNWTTETIENLLVPDIRFKALLQQSLQNRKPIEIKEANFGKRALHVYFAPLINEVSPGDSQTLGVVVLVEDITERKVLERSKDDFLSIASHELRTPLTAIRGNSAMVQKYYGNKLPDPEVNEMIRDIHDSSVRLIEIVNDFLDASSLEQGKMQISPEAFQIQQVIAEVVRDLEQLCKDKNITLIADDSLSTAPAVYADRQRIKQVIYNLIGNAVKFTEQGSITIGSRSDESTVYITVSDTGRGMSAENQRLLFRKFQQASSNLLTRDTTKGTGLGLYISKLILERSGGSIWLLKSEPGQGSTFVFSLPRAN